MGMLETEFVPKQGPAKVRLKSLKTGELFRFAGTHYVATDDSFREGDTEVRRCVDVSENYGVLRTITAAVEVTPATGRLLLDEEV